MALDMMINSKDAKRLVLTSATEDYTGLYEVVWELNTVYSTTSLGEKYAAAETAVRELLQQGWIALYRRRGLGKDETYEPIEATSIEEVLANPVSWYPDYGGVCIVLTSTAEGERVYRESESNDA